MWKLFLASLSLLLVLKAQAEVYSTQIREVDRGDGREKIMVLLANGRVSYLPANSKLADALESAVRYGNEVRLIVNAKKEITSAQTMKRTSFDDDQKVMSSRQTPSSNYTPTVLPSFEKAKEVFKTLNHRANEDSQCYNRAHVWSWEMYNNHLIRPMKIYIFFSRRYIRRYNFDWWFHVAPYVITKAP